MTNDTTPQMHLAALLDEWNRAGEDANTLYNQIAADLVAARGLLKSGAIASVGKNSANQTYKSYGPGGHTHEQEVNLLANLLGLYDQLKSKITCEFKASADFDHAVPADFDFDQPIFELLKAQFTALSSGVATMLPDISQLRVPFVPAVGAGNAS